MLAVASLPKSICKRCFRLPDGAWAVKCGVAVCLRSKTMRVVVAFFCPMRALLI